jgi:hypothetical protein
MKFPLTIVLGDYDAHEQVQQEEIPNNDNKGKKEPRWYADNISAGNQILTPSLQRMIHGIPPLHRI